MQKKEESYLDQLERVYNEHLDAKQKSEFAKCKGAMTFVREFAKKYEHLNKVWTLWSKRFCDREIASIQRYMENEDFHGIHKHYFSMVGELLLAYPGEVLEYPTFHWTRKGNVDEHQAMLILYGIYRRWVFMKDIEKWTSWMADNCNCDHLEE